MESKASLINKVPKTTLRPAVQNYIESIIYNGWNVLIKEGKKCELELYFTKDDGKIVLYLETGECTGEFSNNGKTLIVDNDTLHQILSLQRAIESYGVFKHYDKI